LHLALGQSESSDAIPDSGGILLPGGSLIIKLLEGEESQGTSLFPCTSVKHYTEGIV
jgi:hypothetical protein